eukprot:CAMPEP_0184669810 /NCGR_PEP_ID=MMETSP0308-20130426/79219_1 /TAXON_ID=38269 /ORGANISM="Gloeochaete witrockiana, Strain SAG 46.84" /LENGTH=61 /DNA_ID=CAMNT_0027116263 /DNA_START=200 /DNA_END=382 /DNA_ORIENTATION=-
MTRISAPGNLALIEAASALTSGKSGSLEPKKINTDPGMAEMRSSSRAVQHIFAIDFIVPDW